MNRKQRRSAEAKKRKGDPNQRIADRMTLFGHLPESCSACKEPFDKSNKDMVFSWKVLVRENQESVSLFCPNCIKKTQEILDESAKNQ